jgi:hypothetical protein
MRYRISACAAALGLGNRSWRQYVRQDLGYGAEPDEAWARRTLRPAARTRRADPNF